MEDDRVEEEKGERAVSEARKDKSHHRVLVQEMTRFEKDEGGGGGKEQ
jgi:hypothetical protein